MNKTCLVTGANGFIGLRFMEEIFRRRQSGGNLVGRGAVRARNLSLFQESDCVVVGDINAKTNWQRALPDVEVVVHLAARAHVLKDTAEDPLESFRAVNVDGTVNLADQTLRAGIRRFIFISSIGVNGNQTFDQAFSESDPPYPQGSYAISKLEAEVALCRLFAGSQTELVIVRPPLVYGRDAPGNFGSLMRAVQRGWPLPLGAVHNQRSLVYVGNLVDAIITCLEHPAAAGQTYLVSDGDDVSTPELIRRIAISLGRPARLLPVPPALLRLAGQLTGKTAEVERLLGSLVIDSSKIRRELGWTPPFTMEQGLAETMEWFQGRHA